MDATLETRSQNIWYVPNMTCRLTQNKKIFDIQCQMRYQQLEPLLKSVYTNLCQNEYFCSNKICVRIEMKYGFYITSIYYSSTVTVLYSDIITNTLRTCVTIHSCTVDGVCR